MASLGTIPSKRTLVLSIAPVLVSAYLIYRFSPPGFLTSRRKSNSDERPGPPRLTRGGEWVDESDEVNISSEEEDEDETPEDSSDLRPPYEYYCMFRPFFDIQNENEDKDEDDQLDDDDLLEEYNQEIRAEDNIEMKPATEYPDHRWIAMWETWKLFSSWERRASYTNPDFFKMHIHKHFHGQGMQEMIENMLIAFDKEFTRKKRSKRALKQMWAIVAAMMQWLLEIPLHGWIATGDVQRINTTVNLVGRALLTVLNELDRAKMLKADSEIKDLGLIMTFYLYWVEDLEIPDLELPYRKEVVSYAKRAGIDLSLAGCYGTDEKIKALERAGKIKPISGAPKTDRWDWKKKFKKFSKEYKIGGERFNILKMSRDERAGYAFDKKDPLADISDKALQEGNVRVRPKRGVTSQ
ncbi:hypothetical protein GL218_03102 [Daldinia childiae]|uniref:uncharacterized protein n=1 Tax=Daldinia childiae TaxID=326645 RepID=UPI001446BF0C|nr:uncharacterized protein GL218_03102 [Daldinia childiae]KAF3061026.1 hypothetical protein GL218_03102 [Daldinia childiae]